MGPDGSSKSMAKPRVVGLVLSEMFGLPPPIEKRAVIGTFRVKCGTLDRLGASGVGGNAPLTQTPFAPLARTPLWFPLTANKSSTMVCGSASPEEPGCARAPCPGASTVGVVWADADPAARPASAAARTGTMRFGVVMAPPESFFKSAAFLGVQNRSVQDRRSIGRCGPPGPETLL